MLPRYYLNCLLNINLLLFPEMHETKNISIPTVIISNIAEDRVEEKDGML